MTIWDFLAYLVGAATACFLAWLGISALFGNPFSKE